MASTPVIRWVLVGMCVLAAVGSVAQDREPDLLKDGISSLAPKDPKKAFSQFIDVFQIVKPHPDPDVQRFIDRARSGEGNSFALIAYMIWKGEAGFRESKVAAKIALMRALSEGSAQAPYFIAQSFLLSNTDSETEKLDNYLTGIQWLGVSAGLGEKRAHTEAMRLIDGSAKNNQQVRSDLLKFYNLGLEEAAKYRKRM